MASLCLTSRGESYSPLLQLLKSLKRSLSAVFVAVMYKHKFGLESYQYIMQAKLINLLYLKVLNIFKP